MVAPFHLGETLEVMSYSSVSGLEFYISVFFFVYGAGGDQL